jgi:hypothetical protein
MGYDVNEAHDKFWRELDPDTIARAQAGQESAVEWLVHQLSVINAEGADADITFIWDTAEQRSVWVEGTNDLGRSVDSLREGWDGRVGLPPIHRFAAQVAVDRYLEQLG